MTDQLIQQKRRQTRQRRKISPSLTQCPSESSLMVLMLQPHYPENRPTCQMKFRLERDVRGAPYWLKEAKNDTLDFQGRQFMGIGLSDSEKSVGETVNTCLHHLHEKYYSYKHTVSIYAVSV